MGLDGISINQLRITPEQNSAELNSTIGLNSNETRVVDGLSQGQRVNPDKEHENAQGFTQNDNEENEESKEDDTPDTPAVKYDLSDTNRFIIKLDERTNDIVIYEKSTKEIIQTINADELLKFVQFSPNSYGSIINKKF